MPDRDAEIMAMVDEFLAGSAHHREARTPARTASSYRYYRLIDGMTQSEIPNMPEDVEMAPDETPLDDVIHAGVIGTEE